MNRVGEGQKNVPKLRFKGYEDAWEQRKVSEITKFHKQGYYTTEEYNDNKKYYLLRGTDLTGNKLVLKDTPKIDATEKDYDAFKTEIGDFLIVRSGNVGTYGIVDVDIPAIFGSYLIDFRFDTEKVTNEFFGYFYQSERFQSQLNKITQSSANINVNAENIKSTYISLPVLIEQKKISNIMIALDNCITLHQRKYDALKSMKKTLLSKMFPKNGEDVPEIRFKEFTDAWEQRKLGSDINVTSVKRVHQSDWETEGVPFYRARDIVSEFKGEEISEPIFVSKKTYEEFSRISGKVQADDLLVTGVGTIGVPYLVKSNNPLYLKDGNGIWIQNNKKLDGYFLFYTFITNPIQNFIRESAGTGTVGTLTIETCKRIPVFIPGKREQIAVGEFFQSLDNLITLHQRKLEELKNMKKTLLQQMFV